MVRILFSGLGLGFALGILVSLAALRWETSDLSPVAVLAVLILLVGIAFEIRRVHRLDRAQVQTEEHREGP